ncbi:regulatory protein CII [Fulvimarina pelagi HTCC2506]|uniref:Regulatory protein CII n=1 Tax=Fulvimarina pelagi HTCC2506 TaxID=314231 RepID=Q0G5P9_9HYPH|nr:regulatory protein CII [Fulvimarina pelagi HTCC2506]
MQNYRVRSREGKPAAPTRAYDKWFDELKQTKAETLLPKLSEIGLLLGEDDYISSGASTSQFLLEVPDFNSLIATAQDHSKPVFTLSKGELESSGVVLETQMKNVKKFNKTYQLGAEKISKLCGML